MSLHVMSFTRRPLCWCIKQQMLCEKAWVREASSILFKLAVFPGSGGWWWHAEFMFGMTACLPSRSENPWRGLKW